MNIVVPILCLGALAAATPVQAADSPNILIVWGDDVGQSNISAYTMGLVGYRTPNIDRIAKEGMIFTDYYGEQSCTAGRSSFIMGPAATEGGELQSRPGHGEAPTPRRMTTQFVRAPQPFAALRCTDAEGGHHAGPRL